MLVRTGRPGAGGLVRTGRLDRNAAVIPLCPSLLHAAALREGETPLGRAEREAVRDVARVGQRRRAGAGRRGGGRGGAASWPAELVAASPGHSGWRGRLPHVAGERAAAPPVFLDRQGLHPLDEGERAALPGHPGRQ